MIRGRDSSCFDVIMKLKYIAICSAWKNVNVHLKLYNAARMCRTYEQNKSFVKLMKVAYGIYKSRISLNEHINGIKSVLCMLVYVFTRFESTQLRTTIYCSSGSIYMNMYIIFLIPKPFELQRFVCVYYL